jgi:large subunit ribosomal protein L23
MSDIFLIKKPWVTEKSTDLSKIGKYVFVVKSGANKQEIKKIIKEIYKVDAVAVNIVNKHSKARRLGQIHGRQAGFKKAIVTLRKGQKIEIQ